MPAVDSSFQIGASVLARSTMTMTAIAIPMTVLGLTLSPLSSSVSKYLMRPAEDWKPVSFFFAIIPHSAMLI